jgi:hypothetical protein
MATLVVLFVSVLLLLVAAILAVAALVEYQRARERARIAYEVRLAEQRIRQVTQLAMLRMLEAVRRSYGQQR